MVSTGRRFTVRRSSVHGRGVFAVRDLAAGEELLPYTGRVMSWAAASRAGRADAVTYLFDLGDGRVVDGAIGGNSMRRINHSCAPNCEAVLDGSTVVIMTSRRIAAGRELFLDYALQVEDPQEPGLAERYACHCGHRRCRGTMLDLSSPG